MKVTLKVSRKCHLVSLIPNASGIYGLGIKGGADAQPPSHIIISRIGENSPAAMHRDQLKLGYEITHINNQSVRDMQHEHVLNMIRASKVSLELVIHPRRCRSEAQANDALASLHINFSPEATTTDAAYSLMPVTDPATPIDFQSAEFFAETVSETPVHYTTKYTPFPKTPFYFI